MGFSRIGLTPSVPLFSPAREGEEKYSRDLEAPFLQLGWGKGVWGIGASYPH
jgi:hypothetical protein